MYICINDNTVELVKDADEEISKIKKKFRIRTGER